MNIERRTVLTAGAALAFAPSTLHAQSMSASQTIELWPGPPPGSVDTVQYERKAADQSKDPAHPDRWLTGIGRPVIEVRRPAKSNGAAVLLVPGGGYGFLSYDNEGEEQAAWLNAIGITAFILLYRLPGEGWKQRQDVPLQDAQRAMRVIRSNATKLGIQADRVAVLGFSAGGHLAGTLATCHAEKVYAPVDAADSLSARPDVAGLIYPVISLAQPFTHGGSRDNLLGWGASEDMGKSRSVDQRVTADTPPVFLMNAGDDTVVPAANSIAMYQAMQAAGRPAALHLFEHGGHGFGVRLPKSEPASVWPSLFTAFAAKHGVFPSSQG